MKEILEHFKVITSIPHCSFKTKAMQDFLIEFAKKCKAEVSIDKGGNIHAYKGKPKICLQSHYDMVCMGEAPKIELLEEEGFLKAKDSSLGADNGIGCAIMMRALEKFSHIECLFTNDEEVGLLGANALEHQLKSQKLLNLDHENDVDVTIGCAGGFDVFVEMQNDFQDLEGESYEVEVYGFKGGHSGVDILDNPTNAIKTLASFITQNNGVISEFFGGERINSIPKYAKAKVIFPSMPKSTPNIKFHPLGKAVLKISSQSKTILSLLNAFSHGVRSFNPQLQIAQTSINLAIAKLDNQKFKIELFARSNDKDELEKIKFETLEFFSLFDCKIEIANFYLPWEPKESEFSKEVLMIMKKYNPNAKYYAIHAGLECGIIGSKQNALQCCSIGPNIYNPHSTNERCEIDSVKKISKVVFEIVEQNQ